MRLFDEPCRYKKALRTVDLWMAAFPIPRTIEKELATLRRRLVGMN
jgi:hypothetical protein